MEMSKKDLEKLLQDVAEGDVSPEVAAEIISRYYAKKVVKAPDNDGGAGCQY